MKQKIAVDSLLPRVYRISTMNAAPELAKQIVNPVMLLINKAQYRLLLAAGYDGTVPIVKLFCGPATYLLTGIEDGIAYGYADLSMGCVEWGGICAVDDFATMKVGPFYFERDRHFSHVEGTNYLDLDSLVGI